MYLMYCKSSSGISCSLVPVHSPPRSALRLARGSMSALGDESQLGSLECTGLALG